MLQSIPKIQNFFKFDDILDLFASSFRERLGKITKNSMQCNLRTCTSKLFYSLYDLIHNKFSTHINWGLENQATAMPLSVKQFCNLLLAMPRIINGSINMAPFYTTIIIWAHVDVVNILHLPFFLYCTLTHCYFKIFKHKRIRIF